MPWQFNNGREAGEGNRKKNVNPSVMCFTNFRWCFCNSLQLLNNTMSRMWITDARINHAAHVNTFGLERNQKRNHGNAEHSYFEMVSWFNTETHNYIELIQGFVVVSVDYIIGLAHSPLPPDSKQTTNQSFKFPRKLQRCSNLQQRDIYTFKLEFKTLCKSRRINLDLNFTGR